MNTTLQIICLACCLSLSFAAPLFSMDITTKGEIENLKKRLESLEGKKVEKEALTIETLSKSLTFWGVIEVEGSYSKTEGLPESSDFVLATAQIGTDLHIGEYVGGHIVFLHEEVDTEPVEIDEGNITVFKSYGDDGRYGVVAGKFYLPFGNFNSAMITDPLTLELAETNDSAVMFSLESEKYELHAAVFNGATDSMGTRDNIDTFVAAIKFKPLAMVSLGAFYMNDIAETDNGLILDPSLYGGSVSGAGGYITLEIGKLAVDFEHITALESFDAAVLAGDLTGPKPKAWNVEFGFSLMAKLGLAARYEKANDFKADISRYGVVASYNIFESTVLAAEYLLEKPKGFGADIHSATVQLAFEF
jgi:hypothetical protein